MKQVQQTINPLLIIAIIPVSIKAIQKLINKGITEVRTDNELNNPMYKINESLGFSAEPGSLEYLKIIN